MIYIFSVLIRNSSEIFINFSQNSNKIYFLFSILEFSSPMIITVEILSTYISKFSQYDINIWNMQNIHNKKVNINNTINDSFILANSYLVKFDKFKWWREWVFYRRKFMANNKPQVKIYNFNFYSLGSLILIILPSVINDKFNFYHLKANNAISPIY